MTSTKRHLVNRLKMEMWPHNSQKHYCVESKVITAWICQKDGISLRTTSQILSELLQDGRAWDASISLVTRAQPTPV